MVYFVDLFLVTGFSKLLKYDQSFCHPSISLHIKLLIATCSLYHHRIFLCDLNLIING